MSRIVVVDYDPAWAATFERLRLTIWPAIADVAISVEHVGSTAVPGLAAKPIIDMTAVVPTAGDVPVAIDRFAQLGYRHQGNLGVEGREAFQAPDALPRHHLYLCASDSLALRNHLVVRDYLRAHEETARQYGELKKRLAQQYPEDIEAYVDGKTDMILQILGTAGLRSDELQAIERINRRAIPEERFAEPTTTSMTKDAPVEIVPYDPSWPLRFAEEADVLRRGLGRWLAGPIEHIGSTAVPGLAAKPVIDIMAAVASLEASRPAIAAASELGYCYAPYRPEFEHWFCKPSPAFRTHHLHLVPIDSKQWRRTTAFREYLRAHADVAAEYESLKRRLAAEYRLDREAYTLAKTPFIDRITRLAMESSNGLSQRD